MTGAGQLVDVAMYDAVLSLSERIVYQHAITRSGPRAQGNTDPILLPYGVVRTGTGFVALAAPSGHHWRTLAGIIGRPELADESRFSTNAGRLEHADEVYAAIEDWSTHLSTGEVTSRLGGRVPCDPLNLAADIVDDPRVAAREMVIPVPHPSGIALQIAGSPIKMSDGRGSPFRSAPLLGEHTEEALGALRFVDRHEAHEAITNPRPTRTHQEQGDPA